MRPIYAHDQRARRPGGLDVLHRVQLAGDTLEIENGPVVFADGPRRQLAQRRGWGRRPPIEKLADFGINLAHEAALSAWTASTFRRRFW